MCAFDQSGHGMRRAGTSRAASTIIKFLSDVRSARNFGEAGRSDHLGELRYDTKMKIRCAAKQPYGGASYDGSHDPAH